MKPHVIVRRADRRQAFAAWEVSAEFASGERHPIFGRFGRQYYPVTYDTTLDQSFAVVQGEQPLLIVPANVFGGVLGHYGQPMPFIFRHGLAREDCAAAVGPGLSEIDRLAEAHKVDLVWVRDEISGAALSALSLGCLARLASAEIKVHGVCDLAWDDQRLRRNLRKSFRSLLNWGERNLRTAYVNAASPDRNLFDEFRQFHSRIAGRATRTAASWDAMFAWIAGGGGELALAYLDDGALVAGTMSVDGAEVSYYASGVYDRERFDLPLAHFPLYSAVVRARGRGMHQYDLGELPIAGASTEKGFNIGYFKRGFATSVEMYLAWRWTRRAEGRSGGSGAGEDGADEG